MIISTFETEKKLANEYSLIIGIDEAGRGPLAGPVVAAAAVFKHSFDKEFEEKKALDLIRDSKMLSEKRRESVFDFIQENFHVGIGICDHETIDRINILEASFLAMKKAVNSLRAELRKNNLDAEKIIILVDGNKKIPNFSVQQEAIIGGDKIVKSIAAASIVAKVTRDRMMLKFHEEYPEYNFDKHKGYGTKIHMDALQKHGSCLIHRKSFKPVKKAINISSNIT